MQRVVVVDVLFLNTHLGKQQALTGKAHLQPQGQKTSMVLTVICFQVASHTQNFIIQKRLQWPTHFFFAFLLENH